jgi:cytochrome P450
LARLRRDTPVAIIADGMRYVTRYEDCRDVLRDTASYSNASGLKAPGVEIPAEDRLLGELDPPLHTPVRRVMVTVLTPRAVHAAEPFIAETATSLLDAVPVPGTADLVSSFTVPLPNRVTVFLLGLPSTDADRLAAWAKELMESEFPRTNRTARGEGFAAAFPEFAGYIDDQLNQRTSADPSDADADVITRLGALEVDGARLPRRQARALVRNLITGGLTTTSQLLGVDSSCGPRSTWSSTTVLTASGSRPGSPGRRWQLSRPPCCCEPAATTGGPGWCASRRRTRCCRAAPSSAAGARATPPRRRLRTMTLGFGLPSTTA